MVLGSLSLLFLDGRRCEALLIILVVQISRDIVEGDLAFVVDSALHFGHGLFGLLFGLIFNEEITRVGANVFLVFLHEPVMNYCSELRKALQKVLLVLLPLLLSELTSHVGCDSIGNTKES